MATQLNRITGTDVSCELCFDSRCGAGALPTGP
jgi:hypothetical protein